MIVTPQGAQPEGDTVNKPNTAAPVIMAERRAVVWARLEAHRAARAERRARRWRAAFTTGLVAFLLSLWAAIGFAMQGAWDTAGWLLGASMMAAYCAAVAGEKGAE